MRMTAINLALRNRYGHVVWGQFEQRRVYETGRMPVWGCDSKYSEVSRRHLRRVKTTVIRVVTVV